MSVIVSGVRAATTLDTRDDKPLVVLPESHGEPKLPDAYLLVRTVLERLAVVRRDPPDYGEETISSRNDSVTLKFTVAMSSPPSSFVAASDI
jgi:hypothetical protein